MHPEEMTIPTPRTAVEDRFEILATTAPVGIYELSFDGDHRFANERCHELVGIRFGEGSGSAYMDAIHPDDRQRVLDEWQAAVAEQREFELEYRFLRPDGEVVWVFGRATMMRNSEGQTTGFLGTLTDITRVKRTEERLAFRDEVMRNMAEGVCVIRAGDGIIVDTNPTFDRILGWQPGELHGRHVSVLHPASQRPEDHGSATAIIERLRSGETVSYEAHNVRKDGTEIWCRATTSTFDHPDHGPVWVAVQSDVSEEHRARAALGEAEERFRRAFEDSASGMALFAGAGDEMGQFLDVNPAMIEITGYGAEQLLGKPFWELVHPGDIDEMQRDVAALMSGSERSLHSEKRILTASGAVRWVAFTASLVRGADGEPLTCVVQAQDVTERKQFESELRFLADHDSLTSVFNRRRFQTELERELAAAGRYGTGGATLILDLDDFKRINDTRGHAAGDDLLRSVAHALRERLRRTDILARLGGDEFGIILPHADEQRAVAVAEGLREVIGATEAPGGERITASVGVSIYDGKHDGDSGERVVTSADAAMYAAKEGGRDRVRIVTDGREPAAPPATA
jgi:diguanylate cyclase (GGDEF)-like protein/PAS domain S-box-containing protein